MQWHYADNSKSVGPVSDAQLQELVRTGKITATTLVWREGMAQWQSYESVGVASGLPPLISRCGVCQKGFAKDEMVFLSDTWVCAACKPAFVQAMKEGVRLGAEATVCRSGKLLVMGKAATLPDRCVKCNVVSGSRLVRNLRWHKPAWYLLVLFNLLIYAIVAMAISEKAKIHVGLCEMHRKQRIATIVVCWLMGALSIVSWVLAARYESGWLVFLGIVLLLGGLIYGSVKSRVVVPTKMDKTMVWLKGVCPDYLNTLPEWPGGL